MWSHIRNWSRHTIVSCVCVRFCAHHSMLFLPLGKCCCGRFFFLALISLSRRWSLVIVKILRTKHFENKESAKSKSTSWQPAQLTLLSFCNLRSFLSSIRSLFTLPTASLISKLNIPFRNRNKRCKLCWKFCSPLHERMFTTWWMRMNYLSIRYDGIAYVLSFWMWEFKKKSRTTPTNLHTSWEKKWAF